MARTNTIQALQTTRANLDTQATASNLIAGELYYISDEARFALGTSTTTYSAHAKQSEAGGGGGAGGGMAWTPVTATGTGASQGVTIPESGLADSAILVFVNGVLQIPTTNYTVSGTTVTLTTDSSGDEIQIVKPGGASWGSITGTLSAQTDLNTALSALAPTASPTFTGTLSAATITASGAVTGSNLSGTNTGDETYSTLTTKLSGGSGGGTTNFLRADGTFAAPASGVAWGAITGTLSSQTDLNTALAAKAPTASPTFTGNITMPTGLITSPTINCANQLAMNAAGSIVLGWNNVPMITVDSNGVTFNRQVVRNTYSNGLSLSTTAGQMTLSSFSTLTLNSASTFALQYGGTTKLSVTSTGISVTGDASASGNLSATNLSGTNTGDETSATVVSKVAGQAITPSSVAATGDVGGATGTFSGNISAANKVNGWPFNVTGKTLASERYLLGIAQYAITISQTNTVSKSLVAATASTVFTIKKGTVASPTTIGTLTFAAAGTTATVSISAGAVSAGDMVWIEAPATPDSTLADIAFVVRS